VSGHPEDVWIDASGFGGRQFLLATAAWMKAWRQ
jgi:hypothetical protein